MLHLTFCHDAPPTAGDSERRELARRLERGDVATAFGGRIEGLHRYTSEWIAFDDGRAIDICIDALRRVAG
jgi:hypothetical protein